MTSDEVTVTDVETLKKALTKIGWSAPASVEQLANEYQSFARIVIRQVAEGKMARILPPRPARPFVYTED